MRHLVLFAAVTVLGVASPAHAQRLSPMKAGKFGQICTSPKGAAICDAYITGMADAGALAKLNARSEGDSSAVAGFCIPDGETGAAMRGHVVSWLKAHRDVLDQPVGKSVFAALHDSYSCPAGGTK
ncbi:hypothetical protein AA101099_3092 [Neoasaia chiangmaiensis NBRC 101099]|nr:hypothetical protein AA101099_3092 [Neoasaia chiangmaiensis NBRC 101099]